MSIDFTLDERMVLLMNRAFIEYSLAIIFPLLNANSDSFIGNFVHYNFHCNISRLGIKSGLRHIFFNSLLVEG